MLRRRPSGRRRPEETDVKFLLIMHNNPAVWESLTEAERNAVMNRGTAASSRPSRSPAR